MNVDERTKLWQRRVEDFMTGGLTVEAWCKANGVGKSTLYKWKKKLAGVISPEPASAPAQTQTKWLQVVPANVLALPARPEATHKRGSSSLQIKIAGMIVEVHRDFDPLLLKQVIEVVRSC